MANSKSFLERKEILAGALQYNGTLNLRERFVFQLSVVLLFTGVIAGGVAGVIFAAGLAGLLIYKWQKKADEGYVLGQQRASDEDYYRHNRDEVIVV